MTHELMNEGLENPVVFFQYYQKTKAEDLQIKAAADMGALIFDGPFQTFGYYYGKIIYSNVSDSLSLPAPRR